MRDAISRIIASSVIGGALIGGALIMHDASINHHRMMRDDACVNVCNEIRNAQVYADWCGGYVQVLRSHRHADVIVMNCDA
jgi:hypothetical protein